MKFVEQGGGNTFYWMTIYESLGINQIYDRTGQNTLAGIFPSEYDIFIDLRPGSYSTFAQGQYIYLRPEAIVNTAIGGRGNDTLVGNESGNAIQGGEGNDLIYGLGDNDFIEGGNGSDYIYGGYGDDTILGFNGSNVLFGESGNDTLYSGVGSDYLIGGVGSDRFVFNADHAAPDVIWGFDGAGQSGGDVIDISALRQAEYHNFVLSYSDRYAPRTVHLSEEGLYTVVDVYTDFDTIADQKIYINDGAIRYTAYTYEDFILA